jgi:hypothetical protein
MVEPLRHRQTKEAATDMFDLQLPRHISTLPISTFSPVRSLPLRMGADIGQPIGLSFGQTWLGRPPGLDP